MISADEALAKAFEMIHSADGDVMWFHGPVPEVLVARAEGLLDLRLPRTYRDFVLRYGQGFAGASEFYGLNPAVESPEAGGLNCVSRTLDARSYGLPHDMVLFYNLGNGEDFVLDLSTGKEPRVRVWCSGAGWGRSDMDFVEESFPHFLLDSVNRAIEEAEDPE